jgi:hypothetical protein
VFLACEKRRGSTGVPKQTVNAIRSTAFILGELEDDVINETVRDAFESQVTEFTSDMKLLVEDAKAKISAQVKESIDQAIKTLAPANNNTNPTTENGSNGTGNANPTYASVLVNPPAHANPKLAAREGIKARQFVLLGIKNSALDRYDTQKQKAGLNKIARELGMTEGKIRSVETQRDGSTLIELDSDEAVKWFTNDINKVELCSRLGDDVSFRTRIYNVIVLNVPLTLEPDNPKHREEICETNNIEEREIAALRWAKPINRRSEHQRSAHLVISYTDPKAANRAITLGMQICNKKNYVERMKKEPIRCLKCQGWNHLARDCSEQRSTCSNCAGSHYTSDCISKSWAFYGGL